MWSYSDQVEDVEHNNTSIEGEFDAEMNSFKHIKCFLWSFGTLNTTLQVLEMILMVNWTNSNKSNSFHELLVH